MTCQPGEPGVPYAIGNYRQGVNGGGHKDVAPELGTLEDFAWLVGEIKKRGMEIALDFAINCSPDHPYVKDHPEWFFKRPDGTIKYAENPPKKYQDVYPLNFHNPTWEALWRELHDVIAFWCDLGVRIFRVDNPHTKPVSFWEWLIAEIHEKYPDAQFLSEAFTRPKMMAVLAKAGFTQSYTYFTWRNTKWELETYLTQLTQTEMKDFFRANFFANTPDILPAFSSARGASAIPHSGGSRGHAFSGLWDLQRIRALRACARSGKRRVSRFREVPVQGTQLGRSRQHQGVYHQAKCDPKRESRFPRIRESPVSPCRERQRSLLQQDDCGTG